MRGMKIRMTRETKRLFKVKRKLSPLAVILPLLLVLLAVCSVVYDNSRIQLDEQTFSMPTLPKALDGYSILQISDIRSKQFGQDGAALDEVLKNTSYDVVVMTGDLVAPDNDATGFYQALDYFAAQGKPVYYITGEDDPEITEIAEDGSFGLTQWARTAQQKGAVLLDIPVQLAGGDSDTALWLMPASALVLDTQSTLDSLAARLEDEQLSDGAVQSILYRKARYEAFADAMAKRQHNDLTVMLSHMPCLEASLQSESSTAIFSEADLILSGHNLGGQYCLPFIGALHADNDMLPRGGWFPAEEYLSGLHEVNATYQYVSTGLGAAHRTPFRFRLWNTPQISLIKLTRKLDA